MEKYADGILIIFCQIDAVTVMFICDIDYDAGIKKQQYADKTIHVSES